MSELKSCLHCGAPVGQSLHGNREYCSEQCYYEGKKQRSKEKYHSDRESLEAFKKMDKLLEIYYALYGTDRFIEAALLDNAGMDWSINRGEVTIDDLPVKVLGNYGYCLFKNHTLKIWKLSTTLE